MDQHIFDQLDMLERGARVEALPVRAVYDNSSTEFSRYDMSEAQYDPRIRYSQTHEPAGDGFPDQPMVLDSFGELLLYGY